MNSLYLLYRIFLFRPFEIFFRKCITKIPVNVQRCETQTEMYIKQRMFKRVRDTLNILKNQMNACNADVIDEKITKEGLMKVCRGKRMIVSLTRNK